MSKQFQFGPLNHENAERIGERIRQVLAGKLFSVATVNTDRWADKIDLEVNQLLQTDWVDKTEELVRVDVKDEFATIHFAGIGYNYIFNSRLKSGGDHESFKHPYFVFDSPYQFRIKLQVDEHANRLYTFRVQDEVPWDTDEYHERDLRIHFKAAGRQIPEATPSVAS